MDAAARGIQSFISRDSIPSFFFLVGLSFLGGPPPPKPAPQPEPAPPIPQQPIQSPPLPAQPPAPKPRV